jgi:hypothetical protein
MPSLKIAVLLVKSNIKVELCIWGLGGNTLWGFNWDIVILTIKTTNFILVTVKLGMKPL